MNVELSKYNKIYISIQVFFRNNLPDNDEGNLFRLRFDFVCLNNGLF